MEMHKYGYRTMSHYTRDISFLRALFHKLRDAENREGMVKDAIDKLVYRGKLDPIVLVLRQISVMLERDKGLAYIAEMLQHARGPWPQKVGRELAAKL